MLASIRKGSASTAVIFLDVLMGWGTCIVDSVFRCEDFIGNIGGSSKVSPDALQRRGLVVFLNCILSSRLCGIFFYENSGLGFAGPTHPAF